MELGGRTIERARIRDHLLARRRCLLRLCSRNGREMVLKVNLSLDKLCEELLQVCHSSELVGVEAGIGGRSLFNRLKMGGPERAAASEREVLQGWDRKGMVEAEEDLNFKVADKATVGSNGNCKLVLLFERVFSSEVLFASDRAGTVNDRQALLLRFDEVVGKLVWYGD